jgi:hypothetical protein
VLGDYLKKSIWKKNPSLDQKETLVKKNNYLLMMGFSVLNKHLLKESTFQTPVAHTYNPATWEAEIQRIMYRRQPKQIILKAPSPK